jgi:DNA-binding winged helix-turn-helix (wHTH) protein
LATTTATESYRVGDVILDVGSRLLFREDRSIILPPKTFDLLVALVRRGRAVSRREELIDAVWPGLVVNDETLSQRIRLLRLALGDDPRTPRYIESVTGWGYRLIAPVERLEVAPHPVPTAAGTEVYVAVEDETGEATAPGRTHMLEVHGSDVLLRIPRSWLPALAVGAVVLVGSLVVVLVLLLR